MRVTLDTNVLLRAAFKDDPHQGDVAEQIMATADRLAVTLPAVCEFVWVLRQGGKLSNEKVAATLRKLLASKRVLADRPAIEAGLAIMDAGGDFADGAMAYAGRHLGCEIFLTFDRKAARLIRQTGGEAQLLS